MLQARRNGQYLVGTQHDGANSATIYETILTEQP
jgi:hypothetical protein